MRLLVDTCSWIWSMLDRARLSGRVAKALENPENELWLSPISLWEVLILQKQRLTLHPNPLAWTRNTLDAIPMRETEVSWEIAQGTVRVHRPHRDAARRFLVGLPESTDPTPVTADEQLLKARQVPALANR